MHEKMMRMHQMGGNNEQAKLSSYEVALKGKVQIAEGTYSFTFEKPKGFQFKAGQHIRMTLINPTETDSEGNSRFWTIASTPQDKDLLIAMRMRDTAFKRVLSSMPIGTKVLIQIRQHVHVGAFALHDDSSIPAVFIAGGIGVVPAYSMIKDAIERKLNHKLVLFYSNRRPEDAPFLYELQKLAKQHSNFTLVATMTGVDKSTQKWNGNTGYIDKAVLERYTTNLPSPIYYIAGLPDMVNAMKKLLSADGVSNSQIRSEEFGGFTVKQTTKHKYDTKGAFIAALVVILIIAMISFHVFAGSILLGAGHSKSHVEKQIVVLTIIAMTVVVIVKVKLIRNHRQSKNK